MSTHADTELVLIRHGQSIWNAENRFTGWQDIGLSEAGKKQAYNAGLVLKRKKHKFDITYTSFLRRAIHTANIILDELNLLWIPLEKSWQLNERHYGALQGLNKQDTIEKYGLKRVQEWRRSYDKNPPELSEEDRTHPQHDPKYRGIKNLPSSESLQETSQRVIHFWDTQIKAAIQSGKRVLIVAHGNSLRALMKHLEKISDADIEEVTIPTAKPLIYRLNEEFEAISRHYLDQNTREESITRT